jgi:hypothetical protein
MSKLPQIDLFSGEVAGRAVGEGDSLTRTYETID